MKIIDLLNKRANGEEVPNKIRIDHWCYKFEWVEHLDNYYDKSADLDLMSVLSMSKEELNYEVKIIEEEIETIEEDKPIEKLYEIVKTLPLTTNLVEETIWGTVYNQQNKINEIIDKVNKLKKESDK